MSDRERYIEIFSKVLEARSKDDHDLEDSLMDILDEIWYNMTSDDITYVENEIKDRGIL